MPYLVNYSDPAKDALTVSDNTINGPGQPAQATDLTFYGKNRVGYGETLNENFLHLIENFAHPQISESTPDPVVISHPIEGQIWFNSTTKSLFVYTGTKWVPVKISSTTNPPTTNDVGDIWYDSANTQLKVWNGSAFVSVASKYVLLDGSVAMTGPLNAGNLKILNLATPTTTSDAANKGYVDAAIAAGSGLIVKDDDNAVSVSNTSTVNFENDHFEITNQGSGVAKVTVRAGAITGTPLVSQVGLTSITPTSTISFVEGSVLAISEPTAGTAQIAIPSLTTKQTGGGTYSSTTTLEFAGATLTTPSANNVKVTIPSGLSGIVLTDQTPTSATGVATVNITGGVITQVNPTTAQLDTGVKVLYNTVGNVATTLDAVTSFTLQNQFENVNDPITSPHVTSWRLREVTSSGFTVGGGVTGTLTRRTMGGVVYCSINVTKGFGQFGTNALLGTMSDESANIGTRNLQPNPSFFRSGLYYTTLTISGAVIPISINSTTRQIIYMGPSSTYNTLIGEFSYPGLTS